MVQIVIAALIGAFAVVVPAQAGSVLDGSAPSDSGNASAPTDFSLASVNWNSAAWNGLGWNGIDFNGAAWNGRNMQGVVYSGVGFNAPGTNSVAVGSGLNAQVIAIELDTK